MSNEKYSRLCGDLNADIFEDFHCPTQKLPQASVVLLFWSVHKNKSEAFSYSFLCTVLP